jgi:hypothetical protein
MIDVADLRRRMAQLDDEPLLGIVTTHRRAYRQIAIDVAAEELQQRGVSVPTTPAVAVYQSANRGVRRRVAGTPPPAQVGENGLVLFLEVMCAAIGSIVLAVVLVSERATQKAVLRWVGMSLVLPYTVWRGARLLDRSWQRGGAQQGQTSN